MKAARACVGALAACAVAVLLCDCTRAPARPPEHSGAPVARAARAAPASASSAAQSRRVAAAVSPTAPTAPTAPPPLPAAAAVPVAGASAIFSGANPFAAMSWQAAPAPAAVAVAEAPAPVLPSVPAAVPVPVAPPLPFRFLGRYGDGQVQSVMLAKGERLYLARPGDTIDGAYRVDGVTAQSVELTYLPMQLKQSLSTGDPG